jgi:hypothetical protein
MGCLDSFKVAAKKLQPASAIAGKRTKLQAQKIKMQAHK